MTLLVGSSTGPIISSGSNVELIVDKHPLLVSFCFDYRATLTPNVSVLVSHCNLSALSIRSLSKSRLLTVLSSAVMADNTSIPTVITRRSSYVNRPLLIDKCPHGVELLAHVLATLVM